LGGGPKIVLGLLGKVPGFFKTPWKAHLILDWRFTPQGRGVWAPGPLTFFPRKVWESWGGAKGSLKKTNLWVNTGGISLNHYFWELPLFSPRIGPVRKKEFGGKVLLGPNWFGPGVEGLFF